MVNFAGDQRLIGEFVEVEITEGLVNSLRGELVAESVPVGVMDKVLKTEKKVNSLATIAVVTA